MTAPSSRYDLSMSRRTRRPSRVFNLREDNEEAIIESQDDFEKNLSKYIDSPVRHTTLKDLMSENSDGSETNTDTCDEPQQSTETVEGVKKTTSHRYIKVVNNLINPSFHSKKNRNKNKNKVAHTEVKFRIMRYNCMTA